MQECETGTGKSSFAKRVTVRSGGAGHAHSGIVKTTLTGKQSAGATKTTNGKIVKLGR
jgi:hypothetical protein